MTSILEPALWIVRGDVIKGNIFRVIDLLCGEFTGHRWIPRIKASDAERWCLRGSVRNQQLNKQCTRRWFETPSRSLWHHCNVQKTYLVYVLATVPSQSEYPHNLHQPVRITTEWPQRTRGRWNSKACRTACWLGVCLGGVERGGWSLHIYGRLGQRLKFNVKRNRCSTPNGMSSWLTMYFCVIEYPNESHTTLIILNAGLMGFVFVHKRKLLKFHTEHWLKW